MCTGQLQLYRNFYRSTKQGRTDNSWLNTPPEDNTRKMLSRVEGAAGVHSPRDSLTCCSPSSVILSKKYSLYWYHNNNGKCKPAKKDNKEKNKGFIMTVRHCEKKSVDKIQNNIIFFKSHILIGKTVNRKLRLKNVFTIKRHQSMTSDLVIYKLNILSPHVPDRHISCA